jgi:hypothetical protein
MISAPKEENLPTPTNTGITELNEKAEHKKKAFDRELRSLISQAKEIIIARYGTSIELGDVRVEAVCLNRYLNIYNSMSPQEHYRYFETLYNRKRTDILNTLKSDIWIRSGVIIQFGEGIKVSKEIEEKRKQVRIMLSDIYMIARDLQLSAEKSLSNVDESYSQAMGGKDLIRPTILLLHLMRIFYHLNDSSDKEQLGAIVSHLEDDLGVTRKTLVNNSTTNILPQGEGNNALGGLFNMATNMMERMGYKPPPGMKPPSEAEISTVINTFFNNETTQNAIQGMFSSLQGCQDFGTAVQEVVKNITDPKTMEAIQDSVVQTAQAAAIDKVTIPGDTPKQE